MKHHEHRFMLYSLASAFLLVLGFTFVMQDFNTDSLRMSASVGQVEVKAEVSHRSFVLPTPALLSGKVVRIPEEGEPIPVSGVYVGIHRIDTYSNSSSLVESTISDENGFYVFPAIPLGEYSIRIESFDDSAFSRIVQPEPFLAGFSHSWNFHPVQVHASGVVVTDLDFIVE